jgi:hypothetical protein
MATNSGTPRTTRGSFHVGSRVRFLLGVRPVDGVIIEDRGFIGVGGRRLWGVEVDMKPDYYARFELSEDDFKAAD